MYDYHIHTEASFDCQAKMEDYAKKAIASNISEICFTEHIEIGDAYAHLHEPFDLTAYTQNYLYVKAKYPKLVIKQGVEMGMNEGFFSKSEEFVRENDFDFVIASQHMARGKDPYFMDYYDDIDLRNGQRQFFEATYESLKAFNNYDVIGHIGYVDKYLMGYEHIEKLPAQYKDFPEIFDEILKLCISKGKGIEINTSNIKVWGYATPHQSIIKRFLQLNGEIITTGSDCHATNDLGYKFTETYDFLRSLGVKYICTYTKRKPEMRRI